MPATLSAKNCVCRRSFSSLIHIYIHSLKHGRGNYKEENLLIGNLDLRRALRSYPDGFTQSRGVSLLPDPTQLYTNTHIHTLIFLSFTPSLLSSKHRCEYANISRITRLCRAITLHFF